MVEDSNELGDLSAGFQELMAANGVFVSVLAESMWRSELFPLEQFRVMSFLLELRQELDHTVEALNLSPTPLAPRAVEYLMAIYSTFRDSLLQQSFQTP